MSGKFMHPVHHKDEDVVDKFLDFAGLDDDNEQQSLLSYCSRKVKKDCTMNDKYLFLWDKRQIDYYDLNDPLIPKNKK